MGVIAPLPVAKLPYAAPTPITDEHRVDGFDCGKTALSDWLRTHALDNEGKSSRTYVVNAQVGEDAGNVIAYYTLASGSVVREEVPRRIRHGLPNPVPIMVLGRLAVDRRHSGNKLGGGLLREAMQRTIAASEIAGIRAIVVHAFDDDAVGFYAKYGFQQFPQGTRTMFLPIETVRAAIS